MRWQLWRRRRSDDDFEDEVRAHVALETDRLVDAGVDPRDARAAALRAFGNVAGARERFHDTHHWVWWEQFTRDLGYAWRGLWHSRAFVAATVLTLAVGLGLVTAVFTIFNAYVLRPFAIRDPYGIYGVIWHTQEAGGGTFRWSDYESISARNDLFDAVIANGGRFVTSKGNTLAVGFVSGNYFEALGPPMQLGRGLAPYDAAAIGEAPVAVLSDQTWTRMFDRDPAVIGRDIELNAQKFVVVGVTRPAFQGLDDSPEDLWVPVTMAGPVTRQDIFGGPQPRAVGVIVRLKAGITATQAQSALALEPFESRLKGRLDTARAELRVQATPVRLSVELLAILSPVFTAFALVLVAACANASNVMLARATARQREIGVRLALGASRGRVVRQLLTEGLLISVLAAGAGLLLASLAIRSGQVLFLSLLPSAVSSLVRIAPLEFDVRVFLFALAVATCTTLMFALLPALQATRLTLTDALRGQISGAIKHSTLRNFLVGGQVAISLALLVVAATLVRNGGAVRTTDLGLNPNGVISVNQRGDNKALTARAVAALASDPDIEQVVVTSRNPLFGQLPKTPIVRDGKAVLGASYMFVSPEYFSMLAIPIVHGRNFRPEEARENSGVAVVSAAAAKALWPGDDPVGKTLRIQIEADTTPSRSDGKGAAGGRRQRAGLAGRHRHRGSQGRRQRLDLRRQGHRAFVLADERHWCTCGGAAGARSSRRRPPRGGAEAAAAARALRSPEVRVDATRPNGRGADVSSAHRLLDWIAPWSAGAPPERVRPVRRAHVHAQSACTGDCDSDGAGSDSGGRGSTRRPSISAIVRCWRRDRPALRLHRHEDSQLVRTPGQRVRRRCGRFRRGDCARVCRRGPGIVRARTACGAHGSGTGPQEPDVINPEFRI